MKWLNRLILFILCVFSLDAISPSASLIIMLLSVFTISCVIGYFEKQQYTALLYPLWGIACFFYTPCCLFWPLLLYDVFATRKKYVIIPCCAFFVVCLSRLSFYNALFNFCLACLAFVMYVQQSKANTFEKKWLHMQDEAKETSLILNRQNAELQAAKTNAINLATLNERARISREIHDNTGHIIARAIMQTGAIIAVNKSAELSPGLDGLRQTLDLAMDSMRKSVHNLKDESLDLYALIKASLEDFASLEANLNYDISPDTPRNIKYCFAAIISEALSNTARHSSASGVQIDVLEHPAFYRLYFADNGTSLTGSGTYSAPHGIGIENMRERVLALGGKINFNTQNGYSININIPKKDSL